MLYHNWYLTFCIVTEWDRGEGEKNTAASTSTSTMVQLHYAQLLLRHSYPVSQPPVRRTGRETPCELCFHVFSVGGYYNLLLLCHMDWISILPYPRPTAAYPAFSIHYTVRESTYPQDNTISTVLLLTPTPAFLNAHDISGPRLETGSLLSEPFTRPFHPAFPFAA